MMLIMMNTNDDLDSVWEEDMFEYEEEMIENESR